jgi:DNA-binding transcriptional LysR family regulator
MFRKAHSFELSLLEIEKMEPINFDMDALRAMLVGVELGGFAHAAVRLNRSPSAVSMQLRKLETQSGQKLFKRNGRGLILTEAGDVLLQYARRVLALNDEMGAAVGAITRGGAVRVGMPQDIADVILSGLLKRYAKARPTTHVEVKGGRNYTLADDVTHGRLDMALAFTPAGKGGVHTIATVPTVWIGGARNIKRSLSGEPDSRVVPLVIFDGPCLFREMGVEALSRAGLPWRPAMTTPSLATMCCGIRAGLGVTVRTAIAARFQGLEIVPTGAGLPALPPIDIVLYCATELAPAAQAFRDLLLETLKRECLIDTRARPAATTRSRYRARAATRAPS